MLILLRPPRLRPSPCRSSSVPTRRRTCPPLRWLQAPPRPPDATWPQTQRPLVVGMPAPIVPLCSKDMRTGADPAHTCRYSRWTTPFASGIWRYLGTPSHPSFMLAHERSQSLRRPGSSQCFAVARRGFSSVGGDRGRSPGPTRTWSCSWATGRACDRHPHAPR